LQSRGGSTDSKESLRPCRTKPCAAHRIASHHSREMRCADTGTRECDGQAPREQSIACLPRGHYGHIARAQSPSPSSSSSWYVFSCSLRRAENLLASRRQGMAEPQRWEFAVIIFALARRHRAPSSWAGLKRLGSVPRARELAGDGLPGWLPGIAQTAESCTGVDGCPMRKRKACKTRDAKRGMQNEG